MLERLLRVENLLVIPLVLVAVLVALGARWRNDPRRAGLAKAITTVIRLAFSVLVIGVLVFLGAVIVLRPTGP